MGGAGTCVALVWIPAWRCAPSGMTSRKKGRAVRDDGESKESAVRDDVKQISVPSGGYRVFAVIPAEAGIQWHLRGAPVWIPARPCGPSGMTSVEETGRPG